MFVLDVQTHYKGNCEYWSNLYSNCFNNDVGNALYSYFYEIDTNNYQAQQYPITENKLNSISKRLDFVYQYIKEEYIMTNKDIKTRLSDIYDDYKFWCVKSQKKACQKTDFVSKLKEIQIFHKKSNGYLVYNIKLDVLKEIAEQQHWMTELDEYTESNDDEDADTPSQKAMTVDEYNKYEEIKLKYEELEAENKNMYKILLKSNEQVTNLINMVMKTINMETIKSDLEEFKTSETKYKQDDVIKTKNNKKNIAEFVDSIELF